MKNTHKIIITGLGGQGILAAGRVIAQAAFNAGYQSSYLPSFGPEVHNGPVKAEIIVSNDKIYNPFIEKADYLLVFHKFRLEDAKQYMHNESILICKDFSTAPDFEFIGLKVNTEQFNTAINDNKFSNVAMLGALNHYSELFSDKNIADALKQVFSNKPYNIVNLNFKAYKQGKDNQKVLNK